MRYLVWNYLYLILITAGALAALAAVLSDSFGPAHLAGGISRIWQVSVLLFLSGNFLKLWREKGTH